MVIKNIAMGISSFYLSFLCMVLSAQDMPSKTVTSNSCELKQNDLIRIDMSSNPTTGYVWIWDKGVESVCMDSVQHEFRNAVEGFVGSGGVDTWIFKATSKGKMILKFNYVRPWRMNKVAKTKEVVVTVK